MHYHDPSPCVHGCHGHHSHGGGVGGRGGGHHPHGGRGCHSGGHHHHYAIAWFKVTVSIIDSNGHKAYRSWCLGSALGDTQNKIIRNFKKLSKYYINFKKKI